MILQDDGADLADLVGFGVPTVPLQVDALLDPVPAEDKVASAGPLLEPELPKQTSKIVEIDVGVRNAAADAVGEVLIATHGGNCKPECRLTTQWTWLRLALSYDITYASEMTTITASRARSQFYRLLDQAAESHEPITVTGKRHNAVLISEDDWRAIEETLSLLSIPGMRESIRNGMRTPLSKTSKRPGW
jgi:antitoxin YefM